MGVKSWFNGGKGVTPATQPARMTLATRSFSFADSTAAESFIRDMQADVNPSGYGGSRSTFALFADSPNRAGNYGGQMFRSSYGRELRVYGYQREVSESDRAYLFHRDPTAAMFIEKPPADMWNGFPVSYIPEVDDFFAQQMRLGLLTALQAAYQEFYQAGGGCILLETDGDPTKRIRRGERPLAWTFIPACNILEEEHGEAGYILAPSNNTDPLLDHGLEYVSVYLSETARENGHPTQVHGSRLFPINLDPRAQKWWRTANVPINRIYDTLWELRDIIFARSRAHFQGDPIVVDVDISTDAQKTLNFSEMTEDQKTAMGQMVEQSIVDYNTGAKSSFAPVMGFKMRRLGAAQLPDPKEDVMMLSSRLSHGSVFPVKMVLASTKGSSDVSDQDLLIYAGNIQNIRNTWGYKHLSKVLLMGQVMGVAGLRMQGDHELPLPQQLDWPLLRPLTPRDAAFTEKSDAAIYRELQEAGLLPPMRLRRKFAKDPAYSIPPWMAVRGRDVDGTSLDIPAQTESAIKIAEEAPAPAPSKSSADMKAEYEAWLETTPKVVPEQEQSE